MAPGMAAASSEGSLTSMEYAQLTAARNELKSANLKTPAGLKGAIWDCETIQEVSQLLTEERADCIAQLEMADFSSVMPVAVKNCSVHKDVPGRLKCLMPNYERLYDVTSSFYRAESAIHRIATSRGLTAPCANLLSDPPKVIVEERGLLSTLGSILAAMKTGNVLSFEKYSGEFITAAAEVQEGQDVNSGPLSICRHQ